ncbi:MAG TPA: ABC transporter permease [Candidatus Onthenecus intestinigallinarum]|uniref:ABC transporter permease n=1 Tax=Candidatus Onthenecus intestinigallinarum TaxID=2840875 RepID=A0A9D1CQU7_9FIRM|nr:ABC transporter permease [Candidatus Onthenecus intestinigallinarum]
MGKYVLKRIGYIVLVFLIISLLMYALYNLIPSDPARAQLEGVRQTLRPDEYETMYRQLRAQLGLDDPLIVRYLRWMGLWTDVDGTFNGLLQGNLGYSQFFKKDAVDVIVEPMKNTIFINIFSTILSLGITIPVGIYCAVRKGKKFDQSMQVVTILGYSIPIYIISLIFMFFFCVLWRIFPIMGSRTAGITYANDWEAFVDKLYHITLPVIVMTFASLGGMTRYVRSAMIEALSMDYIRTARAKGLREKVVIYSHAWRNALLPVVTSIFGWFLSIFSGSVIIENTFALNGMGRLYWQGLNNQDFELVLAIQMFYTVVSLVGNLLIDVSYGLVDPRVRVDK